MIIGDTIGQPYIGFIDKVPIKLPNSNITGGISFKKYEYIGADKENKNQVIQPDIFINIDAVSTEKELYETVIKIIKK